MKQAGKTNAPLNMDLAHHTRVGLMSAKVPPKIPGKTGIASSTSDFTLPPILKPLLDEHIKKKPKRDDSVTKTKKHG